MTLAEDRAYNARHLNHLAPASGRLIADSGEVINVARTLQRLDEAIDAFGHLETVEYTPQVERKPLPAFDPLRDRQVGTGTVDVVDGWTQLDGSANAVEVYTRDYGRYLPGLLAVAGVGYEMPTPSTGTYEMGYGDDTGNRIGLRNADGAWSTFVESAGVRYYSKPRSEWLDPLDGTGPSGRTVDISDATLRIKFVHYGGLSFEFYLLIGDRQGDREVLIDRSGPRPGAITLEQPDLPIFAETDGMLYVGGRQFGVYGRYLPRWRNTSSGGVAKSDIGTTYEPIVSFRVKAGVRWDSVPIELADADASGDADGEYAVFIGDTLTGAVWGDLPGIAADETALEMDTSATAISGGYRAADGLIIAGNGQAASKPSDDLPDIDIPRDSVVTLAVKTVSGGQNAFRGLLRLREEF